MPVYLYISGDVRAMCSCLDAAGVVLFIFKLKVYV